MLHCFRAVSKCVTILVRHVYQDSQIKLTKTLSAYGVQQLTISMRQKFHFEFLERTYRDTCNASFIAVFMVEAQLKCQWRLNSEVVPASVKLSKQLRSLG